MPAKLELEAKHLGNSKASRREPSAAGARRRSAVLLCCRRSFNRRKARPDVGLHCEGLKTPSHGGATDFLSSMCPEVL